MSGSAEPPSITSKDRSRRRAGAGPGTSRGFSKPSRVPSTLRSRRIRNSAMAGEDNDLDHLRAHRPTFHFSRPRRWRPRSCTLCKGSGARKSIGRARRKRVERTGQCGFCWSFSALPIVEIALFIEVGGLIGLLADARRSCVLAAVAGRGADAAAGPAGAGPAARAALEAGGDPVGPIAHGALIARRRHAADAAGLLHRRARRCCC